MDETLLLTGFEPFGKWTLNPSWEIASALDGENIGGLRVVARCIPVNWVRSWPALEAALSEVNPNYVLMLGLAGRRSCISVESRACNLCDQTPDNADAQAATADIEPTGPEYREATLPVARIVEAIAALGVPVKLSEDAGQYLCNNTLYKALGWAASQAQTTAPPMGFIHVPNLPGINPEIEGITIEAQIEAVRAAIGAVAATRTAGSRATAMSK